MNLSIWVVGALQPLALGGLFAIGGEGTNSWAEYGVLGILAGAEMVAIVWLTKKLVGYMETTASKTAAMAERVADTMEDLSSKIVNREAVIVRHEERMGRVMEQLERIARERAP